MELITEGQMLPDKVKDTESGLTLKQAMFTQQFMLHGNATLAYERAFNTKNMKRATITREAHELKKNPKVAARIVELVEVYIKRQDIDPELIKGMLLNEARTAGSDSARVSSLKVLAQTEQMLINITKNITDNQSDEELALGIAAAGYELRAKTRDDLKEPDKLLYDGVLAKLKLS